MTARESSLSLRGFELLALAAGLLLTIGLLARLPGPFPDLSRFQPLFCLAFAFYAMALLRLRRYQDLPGADVMVIVVALGARMAFLSTPPILSDDVYRYLWEGRVLAHGMNPWALAPDHPALAALRDDTIWTRVNHRDLAAIYPPLGVAGYSLVALVQGSVAGAKLWVLVHEAALMLVLAAALRGTGFGACWVAAYAWNPLAIVEYAGAGHNDPTAMLWLAVAVATAERRPVGSAIAFAAATLTKLVPLVALPFLWREWTGRARAVAALLTGSGLVAYALLTRGAASGLSAYLEHWQNNELIFHFLAVWTGSYVMARNLSYLLLLAAIVSALVRGLPHVDGARLGVRAGLLLGPVLHPWYLGWELMFQPFRVSWPWLLLSLTAILSYGPLRTPAERGSYHASLALRLVEYGVPLAIALILAFGARRTHRTEP